MYNRNMLQRNIDNCHYYIQRHELALEEMIARKEYRVCHHIQQRLKRLNLHLRRLLVAKYHRIPSNKSQP
jgi:hypothetical protein